MSEPIITDLPVQPFFELEDFMNFSKENRLDSDTLEVLATFWEKWTNLLRASRLESGKNSWMVVWLPKSIENSIDETWAEKPSQGFLMNCLAQYMCMTAVQELVPQTGLAGCAPAPGPHPMLRQGLRSLGLASHDGHLENRYAVVTHFPFRGGCEVCSLSDTCPKKNGSETFASILLPGHEK